MSFKSIVDATTARLTTPSPNETTAAANPFSVLAKETAEVTARLQKASSELRSLFERATGPANANLAAFAREAHAAERSSNVVSQIADAMTTAQGSAAEPDDEIADTTRQP